jgi:hypothetical protein
MLKQWSKKILSKWIDVYTILIQKMIAAGEDQSSKDKLEKELLETVVKMSENS